MHNNQGIWKFCLALAACVGLTPVLTSCTEKETNHYEGVHSFVVRAIPQDAGVFGTAEQPLKYATSFSDSGSCKKGETCYNLQIGAYAVDIHGKFMPDYNETVTLSSRPGRLSKETITFVNGIAGSWEMGADNTPQTLKSGIPVGIRYAHGSTRVWVEDTKQTSLENGCANWKVDPTGSVCEPSLATGTSEEFVFEPQTIRMIQYNPDMPAGEPALRNDYGQIKATPGHDLVVTNVVSTGFYVTDKGDDEYNSIFIFTYSQPARVEIGDRICELSGGIAEFTGMTQLQFPSWGIQNKERSTAEDTDPAPEDGDQGVGSCVDKETGNTRPCTPEEIEAMKAIVDCSDVYSKTPLSKEEKKAFAYVELPEPRQLTSKFLEHSNNDCKNDSEQGKSCPVSRLEALEASIVTVQGLRLSTNFIDCDDNGNGKIESGSAESSCRTECTNNSKTCTEISSLEGYDQWRAWTIDGNAEISVSSSSLIADFNISQSCNAEEWKDPDKRCCYEWTDPKSHRRMMRCPNHRLLSLTGNLKQVIPTCSGSTPCNALTQSANLVMTIIEPRFKSDLIWDEAYNKAANAEFKRCIADDRPDGCLDTCKATGTTCTCADFENYVMAQTDRNPGLPTSCPPPL